MPEAHDARTPGLDVLERGCTTTEALALFDALPCVRVEEIFGRWRGAEVETGHPYQGVLAAYGWYGKEFIDAETVHPLLFLDAGGELVRVDPRALPPGLASHAPRRGGRAATHALSLLKGVVGTNKPRARLRHVEYRGKVSATMIYDHLPVHDAFRRVDETTLLGAMDQRGMEEPFLFLLRRVTG